MAWQPIVVGGEEECRLLLATDSVWLLATGQHLVCPSSALHNDCQDEYSRSMTRQARQSWSCGGVLHGPPLQSPVESETRADMLTQQRVVARTLAGRHTAHPHHRPSQ